MPQFCEHDRMARHLYRCPLRWADMDALQHVNNVTYVDYLQEARVDMLRLHAPIAGAEQLAEGVVVVRHDVDYLAPLVFRKEPVLIDVWVTEVRAATFSLAYEVYDELPDGDRTVYLRARSLLTPFVFADERPRRISAAEHDVLAAMADDSPGPAERPGRVPRDSHGAVRHRWDCQVRFSDVDIYRHVNNVKYYEYIQEARIDFMHELSGLSGPGSFVVGALDVEYSRPILLRPEPYVVESWVQQVGRTSFSLVSEISDPVDTDHAEVLARTRARVVAFDAATGRSVPLDDTIRERLTALVSEPGPGPGPASGRRSYRGGSEALSMKSAA